MDLMLQMCKYTVKVDVAFVHVAQDTYQLGMLPVCRQFKTLNGFRGEEEIVFWMYLHFLQLVTL